MKPFVGAISMTPTARNIAESINMQLLELELEIRQYRIELDGKRHTIEVHSEEAAQRITELNQLLFGPPVRNFPE
jgi:hypothetical protein